MTITDATATARGATATATVDNGAVTAINVTAPGTGYVTRRRHQEVPGRTCPGSATRRSPAAAPTGRPGAKFIPLAVPEREDLQRPQRQAHQGRRVRDRPRAVPHQVHLRPAGHAGARLRAARDARANAADAASTIPLTNELLDGTKRHPILINGAAGLRRDAAAVARPDHRRHQGQAGPHRLPQPAARRARTATCSCPIDTTLMGSGMGPMGHAGARSTTAPCMDGVRNPVCTEYAQDRPTASRRTAPRCTCTAASPRGSATARRTSGSPRPTRTRRARRASASRTCPT